MEKYLKYKQKYVNRIVGGANNSEKIKIIDEVEEKINNIPNIKKGSIISDDDDMKLFTLNRTMNIFTTVLFIMIEGLSVFSDSSHLDFDQYLILKLSNIKEQSSKNIYRIKSIFSSGTDDEKKMANEQMKEQQDSLDKLLKMIEIKIKLV